MFKKIKNTHIHYEERGAGPSLYFVHGLGLDLESMLHTYEPLINSQSLRRVYIDLPGMGETLAGDDIKNSDDVLALLAQFIEEDSQGLIAGMCGHSYGGYLCLGLVQHLGKRAGQLFLTCPVVRAKGAERRLAIHRNIIQEDIFCQTEAFQDYLSMNVQVNKDSWQTYQALIMPGLVKFDNNFWRNLQHDPQNRYQLSLEESLMTNKTEYQGFVLLGKADHVTGFRDQLDLIDEQNQLAAAVIEGAGHNLFMDVPDELAFYFSKFLQGLK